MLMPDFDKENLLTLMRNAYIPGLSIASVIHDEPAQNIALGITDVSLETPILVTSETVFQAASLSKPVFAYLILKLAQQGRFNLDQPLNQILRDEYLSETSKTDADKTLTARMVLSHQTGLPNNAGVYALNFEPGQAYGYSGAAYNYLQRVIELHTGKTLEMLAQEEIFRPLGMKHSTFLPPPGPSMVTMHDDDMQALPSSVDVPSAHATAHTAFSWSFPMDSSSSHVPTFQMVLDHYSNFYSHSEWSVEDKKTLSAIFWKQIELIKTPIIEEIPDDDSHVKVHFLFPETGAGYIPGKKLY